jgi:hypothetical protein
MAVGSATPSIPPPPSRPRAHPGWSPGGPGAYPALLFPVLLAAAALRLLLALRSAPVDDAFITLRYAQNLAAGHGLVYHAGEPVFALSGPLWAGLLAPFFLGGGTPEPFLAWPAILADLGVIMLVYRLAARAAGPGAGVLAAAICGLFPWQALACRQGMETQLFMLLVFGAFACAAEGRGRRAAVLAALAVLTRPEGLIASLLLAAAALVCGGPARGRRRTPAVLWGAIVLSWVAAATMIYGSPVPTSLLAKSRRAIAPGAVVDYFITGNPLLLLVWGGAILGAFLLVRQALRDRSRWTGVALCAAWAASYLLFFLVGRPSFLGPWYRPPILPALAVAAAVGVVLLGERLRGRGLSSAGLCALAVLGWTLLCAAALPRVLATAGANLRLATTIYRPLGSWVRDHTGPDDTVLAGDIGYVGYLSGRRILDLGGLVTPGIVSYLRAHPTDDSIGADLAVARRPAVFIVPDRAMVDRRLEEPVFCEAYRLAAVFPAEDGEHEGGSVGVDGGGGSTPGRGTGSGLTRVFVYVLR